MSILYNSPAFLALTTVIAVPFALFLYDWVSKKIKFSNPKTEFLFEAGVSTQMIPRFIPSLEKAHTLYVVGGDGAYFTKSKGNDWCDWLLKVASKGIIINYILIEMSEECEKILQYKCRHENIHFFTLKKDRADFYEKYLTYHPTLLDSDDKQSRLIWLENNHPQNSSAAYSINFVTPKESNFEDYFEPLKEDITVLISNCDPLKYKNDALLNIAA